MPYTKIYIHAVWATKDRFPYLEPVLRQEVIEHISENAKIKNI
jgi:putative transposase